MTTIEQSLSDLESLKACCKTDEARAAKLEHGIVEMALVAAEGLVTANGIGRVSTLAGLALNARQEMRRRFDEAKHEPQVR